MAKKLVDSLKQDLDDDLGTGSFFLSFFSFKIFIVASAVALLIF